MFYSIEGIDGAGCGVVRRELEKILNDQRIPFNSLKYPVSNLPFGREIYDFLAEKIYLPTEAQFLAFAGQMVIEKKKIRQLRKKLLIIDRYLPCTMVYQGAHGFPIKKGLLFAKLFELEMPDKIFYLKVPWRIAYDRKQKEKKSSDLFEKDKNLYQKTAKIYNQLARQKLFAPWVVIDATKTPKEEVEDIFEVIMKDLKKNA